MKKALRWLAKTVKWIFIVFFVFLASLFFREQRLPRSWTGWIADRYSSPDLLVRCEGAAVGFWRGFRVVGVKVCDRRREACLEPVVTARSIEINPFSKTVRIVGLRYPRLPDSYYSGPCVERHTPLALDLPKLPEFRVVLDEPEILGLAPSSVTAQINMRKNWVMADDVNIYLPWRGRSLAVDGAVRLDLVSQTLHADVRGNAMPEQIRPLIVALDLPTVLPYMDAFTDIPSPVPARGDFDVNLVNGDFRMVLDLKPTMGRYRGVPMSRAEGVLDLAAYTRGTNCNVNLTVGLPIAFDTDGARLSGAIALSLTNGLARLSYDVKSELSVTDALEMADFIDPDALSMLVCETKPVVNLKGTSGTSADDSGHNDITFGAYLEKGSFMGLPLRNAVADFRLVGEAMDFSRVEALGGLGGSYKATARLAFPGYDAERMSFSLRSSVEGGALQDIAGFLGMDATDRDGRVDGWCEFSGPVGVANALEGLCGRGSFTVKDGHIAQLGLFAGLTKMLADTVPGVGYIVNQSDASVDFTVTNGVLRTENLYIEGGLVSLKGWGSYDMARDDIDFTVRVQFLKNESMMGRLVHPVTWPFTKLLLEFKAKGGAKSPEWDYISILDRIL